MHSARRGFVTVCKNLIKNGADLWATSVDGKLAIDFCDKSAPACKEFLEREMKRYMLWKTWLACSSGVRVRSLQLPNISVDCDVLTHVMHCFPEDLFVELVSNV